MHFCNVSSQVTISQLRVWVIKTKSTKIMYLYFFFLGNALNGKILDKLFFLLANHSLVWPWWQYCSCYKHYQVVVLHAFLSLIFCFSVVCVAVLSSTLCFCTLVHYHLVEEIVFKLNRYSRLLLNLISHTLSSSSHNKPIMLTMILYCASDMKKIACLIHYRAPLSLPLHCSLSKPLSCK